MKEDGNQVIILIFEEKLNRKKGWKPKKIIIIWSKCMVKVCGTLRLFESPCVIELMETADHLHK